MISLTELRSGLRGSWVAFEPGGTLITSEPPVALGPAVMLVTEVVDAMKAVEFGMVVDSVDRDQLWAVEGLVLSREVLDLLGEGDFELEDLIQKVRESGFDWQVTPISGL